ncbi:MAG: class I SAM-dependent methyltransferase [Anaerolineales bacterium]
MPDPRLAFFAGRAPEWDAMMPPDLPNQLAEMLAPFAGGIASAGRMIEIGTGTGALVAPLRALNPTAALLAFDLAWPMLRLARGKGLAATFICGDAHRLPLPAATADLVLCHNSFPHFRDADSALGEIRRVLRPGGRLLILHNQSREAVNAIHARVGGAVAHDLLPDAASLREQLGRMRYTEIMINDNDQRFTAICER